MKGPWTLPVSAVALSGWGQKRSGSQHASRRHVDRNDVHIRQPGSVPAFAVAR